MISSTHSPENLGGGEVLPLRPSGLAAEHNREVWARSALSMQARLLSSSERAAIHSGTWFTSLSPEIRHDLLCKSVVKRYRDGDLIYGREASPSTLDVVVHGAVCIGPQAAGEGAPFLAYLLQGAWFVDAAALSGDRRIHCAHARGHTRIVSIEGESLHLNLMRHQELRDAVAALRHRLTARLFERLHDLVVLPLAARLAKCLLELCAEFGVAEPQGATRIGIALKQTTLARMVGASRQRLNRELRLLEQRDVVRIGRELRVLDRAALAVHGGLAPAPEARPAEAARVG